jgi:hypothetical protein
LVAKLAESNNEQWWRVRLWWFQPVGPLASPLSGFAKASAFAPVRPLRESPEKASTFAATAPKQRQEPRALESVAIHQAPCHNKAFNRTRGKLLVGFAGLVLWPRRLRQTLYDFVAIAFVNWLPATLAVADIANNIVFGPQATARVITAVVV